MNAHTSLPALLDILPPDSAHPPQSTDAAGNRGSLQCASPLPGAEPVPVSAEGAKFSRDKQVAFLSALAAGGAARRAVRAAGISHQTAYRMRRANPAFRLAWDAAMLAARAVAEDVLAVRAIEGVEEKVFYHGEEVATRRRFDSRLLLAHLARLDRLTANAAAHAFAEDFEAALDRFARGEEEPVVAAAPAHAASTGQEPGEPGQGDFSSPGQCNKRSMSPAPLTQKQALAAMPCDCPGARHGTDGGQPHWRMTAQGPEPVSNPGGHYAVCCDYPRWPQCRACPHFPPVDRAEHEREEARGRASRGRRSVKGQGEGAGKGARSAG
ncbi:hypothetical protein U4960_12505 [Altererythrobacter sp. H2]|uniref:hypothetical protein n=1 Tax=Altererythrobacter sp. H2 TaxID=3108391 RepID=UPI002B4C049E|nr:hypothetical protein [Altererythrobacter sp. H2]WRK95104.1 hypothetical protein U4960_12505 [Altererythrobacter sp. H2]